MDDVNEEGNISRILSANLSCSEDVSVLINQSRLIEENFLNEEQLQVASQGVDHGASNSNDFTSTGIETCEVENKLNSTENTNDTSQLINDTKSQLQSNILSMEGLCSTDSTETVVNRQDIQDEAEKQENTVDDNSAEKLTQSFDNQSEDRVTGFMNDSVHTDQVLESAVDENQNSNEDFVSNDNDEPMDSLEEMCSYPSIKYNFSNVPLRVTSARTEFQSFPSNFLKGCKWSPDGTCLLTNSDDNILRLFNLPCELYSSTSFDMLPEMSSVLQMSEGETVYDYCWYPFMNSSQPETCCLLSSSRDHPVHMWDAFTGKLRCSYRPYNHMDEIVAATSVSFNIDGSRIFCGFNKTIKIFDTNRPGRDCLNKPTIVKKKGGQSGIISTIAFSPDSAIYALGSFSKSVGIYDESTYRLVCLLEGHSGGVTHIIFASDGLRVFSGGRKDDEILCWDLRNPGSVLYRMLRHVDTNQRIYFDLDSSGQYLVSGNQNGIISVWDTYLSPESTIDTDRTTLLPTLQFNAHKDCVNGVSFHPSLPVLASASGQRKFPLPGVSESDDDDIDGEENGTELFQENMVHLWSVGGLHDMQT